MPQQTNHHPGLQNASLGAAYERAFYHGFVLFLVHSLLNVLAFFTYVVLQI